MAAWHLAHAASPTLPTPGLTFRNGVSKTRRGSGVGGSGWGASGPDGGCGEPDRVKYQIARPVKLMQTINPAESRRRVEGDGCGIGIGEARKGHFQDEYPQWPGYVAPGDNSKDILRLPQYAVFYAVRDKASSHVLKFRVIREASASRWSVGCDPGRRRWPPGKRRSRRSACPATPSILVDFHIHPIRFKSGKCDGRNNSSIPHRFAIRDAGRGRGGSREFDHKPEPAPNLMPQPCGVSWPRGKRPRHNRDRHARANSLEQTAVQP